MYRNGKLRIILLEVNDTVRKVLSESLTYRGYEVFAYPKPTTCPLQILPECWCTNNQSCTDVILTDLDMPGMDGLQFVENLKKKNCKCSHVGIMSGWLTSGDIQRAEDLDCKIFQKPFKMEIFILSNLQESYAIGSKDHPNRTLNQLGVHVSKWHHWLC